MSRRGVSHTVCGVVITKAIGQLSYGELVRHFSSTGGGEASISLARFLRALNCMLPSSALNPESFFIVSSPPLKIS
jgi:hypothetical protein